MKKILDSTAARAIPAFFVLAALVVYVCALSLHPVFANHDVGWTIYAGGQLLDGARFGEDLIDNNPPLIYWTSAVVNGFARIVGAPVFTVYDLLVLALILWCAYLCWRLFAEVLSAEVRSEGAPVREVRDSLGLAIAAVPVIIAGYGYGQRDLMIAVLLLPYVISAGLAMIGKNASRPLRLAVGVASGLALSLKPHYVIAWLAVELVVLVRSRRFTSWSRLENWTMAVFGATYVASVFLMAPGYLETVRDTLAVYHAYDNPVPWLSSENAVVLVALVVLALARPRAALGAFSMAAAIAAVASLLVVILQKKGFDYHYVPMLTMSFMAISFALVERLIRAGKASKASRVSSRLLLVFLAPLFVVGLLQTWSRLDGFPERAQVTEAIKEHGEGQPVLYFSSSVDPLFPSLVFTDSSSASPYSCLWLVAGNYTPEERRQRPFPYRSAEEMGPLERQFVTTIVDAMESQAPSLLFFDRRVHKQSFGAFGFEFERYFMAADPRFSQLMRSYRSMGSVGTAEAYRRIVH